MDKQSQCDMCFQRKEGLMPVLSGMKVYVCKSCAYKLQSITGFLEYHGVNLEYDDRHDAKEIKPPAPKIAPKDK